MQQQQTTQAPQPQAQKRTDWLQTFTGVDFFPIEPDIEKINILDIAHSLALQCRYAGHSLWHYSVAQHSFLISLAVPKELALAGLLHDASEAYLTDIPRPLKPYLPEYKKWERAIEELICQKFGVNIFHHLIKEMDSRILYNERDALMGQAPRDWCLPEAGPIPGIEVVRWTPEQAENVFLHRYYDLISQGE